MEKIEDFYLFISEFSSCFTDFDLWMAKIEDILSQPQTFLIDFSIF
jgi:hypothetical protein